MSLLHILRNLAVLVILTVGGLALTPRHTAASGCYVVGSQCLGGCSKCRNHAYYCCGWYTCSNCKPRLHYCAPWWFSC